MEEERSAALGDIGVFSFQASKNLNSGEGVRYSPATNPQPSRRGFHNNGNPYGSPFNYTGAGCNLRMTEFQGALLLEHSPPGSAISDPRRNAKYLTGQLQEIHRHHAARQYEGCTRNAYHLA